MSSGEQRKTALVTGCSTGIGASLASLLVQDGWIVFAGVRKQEDAEKLRSMHANIRPLLLDVTKPEQIRSASEQVRIAVGEDGLDALVNNAAIAYSGPCEFVPTENFVSQFNNNFFGVVELTQAVLPLLRMGKPGRVMNVSSIASDLNYPYAGPYCASKAALDSYTNCLRQELRRWGIKTALLKPGPVLTNFTATREAEAERFKNKYPPGTTCHEYYGKDLDHPPKLREKFRQLYIPPTVPANVIKSFLDASSPRCLYYDTWATWRRVKMAKWTTIAVKDKFLSDVFFNKDT